ncbi:hypothetical protein CGCF415_v008869 [Colletotrichum fructicola]|nr:hypothetical protein CGCFRS4_v007109 [Colletotrichum fructicola]KAF4903880.1 hypothetical protein CGCF415_v008869 [Colletotrichum fructicola]KAF4934123.1 hypothetical protein CGCF245_v009014 [Colletotrichum fructicola]
MAILERPTPVARHGDFCLQGTQFYAAPLTVAALNGDTVDADAASTSSSDIYGFVGPKGFNAIGASTDTTYARIYTIIYISNYKLYSPPNFSLSTDCIVLSSRSDHLSASANALLSLIRTQASIPPKPLIHMKGTRGRKVDFDIKLNLMGLLVPDDTSKRMQYIRCVSEGEMAYRGGVKPDVIPEVGERELEEWCRRFVEDPAQVKSFALDRVVANLDTMWIEGQLRALLAATQYKGVLHVSFPVTHAKVVVQTQPKANKFMTSMKKLFSGKHKYEVVQSVWPFATAKSGDEGRRCAVQSEEVWWREWRDPIRYAVSQKRQNGAYVTNEDKLEALMEGKGQDSIDWGGVEAIDMPDEAELEG